MNTLGSPIETIMPGARLAEPAVDDAGRLLVPSGTVLTASLLEGLLRRGIKTLCVEREQGEDLASIQARKEQIAQSVAHCFRRAGDGMASRQLREAVMAFRLEYGA